MKKKYVFLQNIIYPIRDPFYKKLKEAPLDFKVLFLSDTASNRKWKVSEKKLGYQGRVLPNFRISINDRDKFDHSINYTAPWEYIKENPDVLITWGWANPANYIFMFMHHLRKKTYYIWVESTLGEPSWKRRLMKPLIKYFVVRAKACIVPGKLSSDYVRTYSEDVDIIKIPNAVDNKYFAGGKRKRKDKRVVFIYVGRFEKIKGVDLLLEACKILSEKYKDKFVLQLVGYGSQDGVLRNFVKVNDLGNCVKIIGHVEREEMPNVYRNADVFVLPSKREPWGIVVNEAMAASLPMVVSNKVGCSADLVKRSVNGYVFTSENIGSLAKQMEFLLLDAKLRSKFGAGSKKIIAKITYDNMVNEFLTLIR